MTGTTEDDAMALILIVDDDEPVVALLSQTLELAGYDMQEASDGPTALRAVEDHTPDLVVLDVMMPGLSGLEVLAEWRERPRMRDVPVIALTAAVDEETRAACVEAGATEYLTKPFSVPDLLARIRRLVGEPAADADRAIG